MAEGSIEYHKHRLRIAKDKGDKASEVIACGKLGIAYYRLGDFKQAIDYHKLRLNIVKELGDRVVEGRTYGNLGIAYHSLGDYKQAIAYHKLHLSIAKEIGDKFEEGRASGNLGSAYYGLYDVEEAMALYEQQLSIAKEVRDRTGEAAAYSNLGNICHSRGDYKQAMDYFKHHLSIAKEMGDKAEEGGTYGRLGSVYRSLGDFKKAVDYYTQHLYIAKQLGNRAAEGHAYGQLGAAYHCLGDFKQAIDFQELSLSIAKEAGNRPEEANAYSGLGCAHRSLGDFKQAIAYHELQLSIAKIVGGEARKGYAYGNLGTVYHDLGDYEKAMFYHKLHVRIAEKARMKADEGSANGNLGNAYDGLGKFEEAIECHEKHLAIAKDVNDRDGEGRACGNLGKALRSLHRFEQALHYQKLRLCIAKELGDRDGEGRAYGNLGSTYTALGDHEQAIEYHKQYLDIAKEVGDRTAEGVACLWLGGDFEIAGSLLEAQDYYRSSIKLFNEVRASLEKEDVWKISFRSKCQNAYISLLRTLLSLSKTEEALCVAEQGRAQALMELMKLQYGFGVLPLGSFEPKETIADILSIISTQTIFIALESNRINIWVLKRNVVHFERREIGDATSLIERAFNEVGVRVGVKCENRSLNELDESPLREESGQETIEASHDKDSYLRFMYDSVLGPVAKVLEGEELIVVPDGPLCLAPYAAFMDEVSKFLSESVRIRIIPSLTSLKLIADIPEDYHSKSGALLVGDPFVEEIRPKLDQLPCAREEVEMIGKICKVEPLTGIAATKDEVLARIASVALVHIAAHGDMKAGEIALTPNPNRKSRIPKGQDYLLTISDVQAVQLRARLVVLSCCHSAQGRITAEGVVGIARAFLGAGARSVLVSLWAIDDEATMEFMARFYGHLLEGKSASVALNRAMRCLRESEKFSAVKYWAPFVLIGDDVTLEF